MPGYVARWRRREVVEGKRRPEEIILLKVRQHPWSIHLKWVGDANRGDTLQVFTSQDGLLKRRGHNKVTLDSTWYRTRNRHALTQLGIGPLIKQFGEALTSAEKNADAAAKLKDLGVLKRPEFGEPVHAVLQHIPARTEPLLPRGGQRFWFFDTTRHLPVLVITHDHLGMEVEYYCFEEINSANFTEAFAFDLPENASARQGKAP
jgi:hypothetical protein